MRALFEQCGRVFSSHASLQDHDAVICRQIGEIKLPMSFSAAFAQGHADQFVPVAGDCLKVAGSIEMHGQLSQVFCA
ncbi:hypothetical protein D0O09_31790 [Pseudomonas putida]|nr:hypothetical protein D0O09_31790 [Pseudomonas putida]